MMNVALISDNMSTINHFLNREVRGIIFITFHPVTSPRDVVGRRFDSAIVLHYQDHRRIEEILTYIEPSLIERG